MSIRLAHLTLSSCLLVSFAAPALATDYYVDPSIGNDSGAGTDPAAPWKTLSFAGAHAAPGSQHTIHVGPGIYSLAAGELFPLRFNRQHIVGEAGSAHTIIDGTGVIPDIVLPVPLLEMNGHLGPDAPDFGSISGLTIRNAPDGVVCSLQVGSSTRTFEDLAFENMSGAALAVWSNSELPTPAEFHIQLLRVRFKGCRIGLNAAGNFGNHSIDAIECQASGMELGTAFSIGSNSAMTARFQRCRFTGLYVGVRTAVGGPTTVELSDCLIANTQEAYLSITGTTGSTNASMRRCTIANNAQHGIRAVGSMSVALEGTLFFGNAIDYTRTIAVTASHSQIGGLDPLFRDPEHGDFRVNFGSPVIDAGDPATAVGTLDLAGVPRSIDGDLDTVERADIGCHEFRTLDMATRGQVGTPLVLEVFGAAGGTSTLHLARGPLQAPVATSFGQFDMNPALSIPWLTVPVLPGPGFRIQRMIPASPMLIGQTYSFQGLVTSLASPTGAAWSNAVSFTIVP